jgi:hypothetical protein
MAFDFAGLNLADLRGNFGYFRDCFTGLKFGSRLFRQLKILQRY